MKDGEDEGEDVCICYITLRKGDDTVNWKWKNLIARSEELAL